MKKCCTLALLIVFVCSFCINKLYAQGAWLPPQSFPSSTDACDDASWKLVFYDDFDGDELNRNKWRTYGAWYQMPYTDSITGAVYAQDHENWPLSRATAFSLVDDEWTNVALDKNVVVSDGTVKLKVYHEPVTWQCDTCAPILPGYTNTGRDECSSWQYWRFSLWCKR